MSKSELLASSTLQFYFLFPSALPCLLSHFCTISIRKYYVMLRKHFSISPPPWESRFSSSLLLPRLPLPPAHSFNPAPNPYPQPPLYIAVRIFFRSNLENIFVTNLHPSTDSATLICLLSVMFDNYATKLFLDPVRIIMYH